MKTDIFRKKIKKKYTSGPPGHVLDAEYFYYDTAPNYQKDLAIVCGGYEKCAPDFLINRSNYPYFFIKYTIKGKGILQIRSQIHELKCGILTGFEPGTSHLYKADPKSPMEHIFLTFIGQESLELFQKSTLAQRHYIEVAEQDEMLNLFQKILRLGTQKPEFSQELCGYYLRIILLEKVYSLVRTYLNTSLSMQTYLRCKKYIDNQFSNIRSPGQVAEQCEIDVRYMSALFKKYCHISPGRYLMRLKLNKAANLLLSTNYSIKEIAFQIGFNDPYHFSKNFKQFHGRSPNHYRLEHMSEKSI